jgi:uncharacterized protein (DUF1800 family)
VDQASADCALLYRRAGFGATPAELATATAAGYEATVQSWVAGLSGPDAAASALAPPELVAVPTSFAAYPAGSTARRQLLASARRQLPELVAWWVARMMAATNPLTEKLPLVLHNLFPTAVSKVQFPSLMLAQNEIFRSRGAGPFDALVQAVSKDPAMLIWLDAGTDNVGHPNENFARELMERFTMGIGTYTQADVTAAAVCFTGWRFDIAIGAYAFAPSRHDFTPQTFLGSSGVDTGEHVIDIVTHSAASQRWVPSRVWSFMAYPVDPGDPVLHGAAAAYAANLSMKDLVRAVLLDPTFRTEATRTGLVKQPVEWVAGTLKALGVAPAAVAGGRPDVSAVLAALGQVPFDPPSVGGWPQNDGWLSTAAALARWQWVGDVLAAPGTDISVVADAAPGDRAEAAASLLSLDRWSPATASALARVADDPVTTMALSLVSPEYVAN